MLIASLYCLFAPLPLWLIEQFLPYPYFIEEFFKFFLVKHISSKRWYTPIIFGVIFSVSESFFYLTNFFQLGNFYLFPIRLLLTTSMHCLTFSLIYFSRQKKYLSYLFLILSILIHFFYNQNINLLFN